MKCIRQFIIVSTFLTTTASAQKPLEIPLSSEPHHHLTFHNRYVNVYHVEVAPRDSVLLHRHDYDAISIMLDDAQVTVHAPGRPDASQNLLAAQIRLQPMGYAHSTSIEGNKTYRNVTVELLMPQKQESNLCAAVMAGQPLHCAGPQATPLESAFTGQPQFETDHTKVFLGRLRPHQEINLHGETGNFLFIAIDDGKIQSGGKGSRERILRAGDFVWLYDLGVDRLLKNVSGEEARIVVFQFAD